MIPFGRILALALPLAGGFAVQPARAALHVGDAAPDFAAPASLGGQEFRFSLADALKKGPVVLYFYPAAFTRDCTIEAHEFADATSDFAALGATVIGVSTDSIATLDKFSVSECRGKFAVAADPDKKVTRAYDAVLAPLLPYADRTSYVIGQDGRIAFSYTALAPDRHVELTLAAVRQLRK